MFVDLFVPVVRFSSQNVVFQTIGPLIVIGILFNPPGEYSKFKPEGK